MKNPKTLEIPELEQDYLEIEELNEIKEIANLDAYYEDYISYEADLTQLIREGR